MFPPGKQYTTKTTVSKTLGWPAGMVEAFLGDPDYTRPSEYANGYDMQMYSTAQAMLFHDCPEMHWRKARKARRTIAPKPAQLAAWQAGQVDNMREATLWCIQRVTAGEIDRAMGVVPHLDLPHLDVFYGLSREQLPAHTRRALTRLPQWDEPSLRRHLVRAIRRKQPLEALALGRHPLIVDSAEVGHAETALDRLSVSVSWRLARHLNWTEEHDVIASRMAIKQIRAGRLWALPFLPSHVISEPMLDKCVITFIERTRRDMGQEMSRDFLSWARSVWEDKTIMASLGRVATVLEGGSQTRNVSNFIKVFENLAKEMPVFDDVEIKSIKREVGRREANRGMRFRSMVLRKQLEAKAEARDTPTAGRPRM